MRLSIRFTMVGAVFVALSATTTRSNAQDTRASEAKPSKPLKPSADLITVDQIQARTFPSVYDMIEAVHSNWLRPRNMNPAPGTVMNPEIATGTPPATSGSASKAPLGSPREASGIQVYVDGTRVGGIETLKSLPTTNIYTIRRINGTDAQQRFGIGHSDGVIYISTAPNKDGA